MKVEYTQTNAAIERYSRSANKKTKLNKDELFVLGREKHFCSWSGWSGGRGEGELRGRAVSLAGHVRGRTNLYRLVWKRSVRKARGGGG